MGDVGLYILRGLGIGEDYLTEYQKMGRKITRAFAYIIGSSTLLLPAVAIAMFFAIQDNYFLFMITFAIYFVPVAFFGTYITIILFKISYKYAGLIEKTWMLWPGSNFMNNNTIKKLIIVGSVETFFVVFILGYISREILILVASFLFLAILPALSFAKRDRDKMGYALKHLFRGDVDQIAEKLAIMLNGKKKLLIKSQSSRRYMIEFQNPSNFKLFVFRRADRKEFTEVSIMGVKPKKLSEVKSLIVQIEKALQ